MQRWSLKELHEHAWMPKIFRNGLTDFIRTTLIKYKIYFPIGDVLAEVMRNTNCDRILDLCSGSAGPYMQLLPLLEQKLNKDIAVRLTDLHPNLPAFVKISEHFKGKIDYIATSVNAKEVSQSEKCIRTFFSSFHHFAPHEAHGILKSAVKDKAPICIFEFTERKLSRILKDGIVPLAVLFLMPRNSTFNFGQFFFTYVIPVFPLLIWYDSIMSNLRSYSTDELMAIAKTVEPEEYQWTTGQLQAGFRFFNITYLIGHVK